MKLLRATAAISILAGPLLSPTLAHADDRADVEAATSSWIGAFNRKNVGDIVALYAPDAVLLGTSSPLLRDSPDLVRDYFKDMPSLGDAVITLGERRVQVIDDIAISTGFYTRSARQQDGETVRNPARFSFVYQKRNGRWLIVNHHSSALPQP